MAVEEEEEEGEVGGERKEGKRREGKAGKAGRTMCVAVEEEEEEGEVGGERREGKRREGKEGEKRRTEEKDVKKEEKEEGVVVEWETLFAKVTCEGSEREREGTGGGGLEESMEVDEGCSEESSFRASVLKVVSACLRLLHSHNVYQVRSVVWEHVCMYVFW